MMTTGYDCPDILNLCLMRPIFSPTDFIQIKGRGTRKHNFTKELLDNELEHKLRNQTKRILNFLTSLPIVNTLKKNLTMMKC